MLSKPLMRVLISLIKGNNSLRAISQEAGVSASWASNLLHQLTKLGFCEKEREGNLVRYFPSRASPILKLIKLVDTEPGFDFEVFLTGLNLRILMFCVITPKTIRIIAKNLGTSVKAIQNRVAIMQGRGLLARGDNYQIISFNPKMYPHLEEFLKELRLFSDKKANILWKFEKMVLFETRRKEEVEGVLTGFSRYSELGVPIYLNVFCCYLPLRKLSKEEIFVHSILEMDHARLVLLGLTFYLKHKLNQKKLEELAREYDCLEQLEDLERILKQEKTRILPFIKEGELKEFLGDYGVKWKEN